MTPRSEIVSFVAGGPIFFPKNFSTPIRRPTFSHHSYKFERFLPRESVIFYLYAKFSKGLKAKI